MGRAKDVEVVEDVEDRGGYLARLDSLDDLDILSQSGVPR